MKKAQLWPVVKQAGADFVEDDAMTLAGAIAFYTALSFAPMLLLLITIGGFLPGATQDSLVGQVQQFVGPQAGQAVDEVLQQAGESPNLGTISGIIGGLVLLFSASGVFAQLQYSMNRIWDVKAKPSGGVWAWVRKRILSIGMLIAIAFLLMVSLVLTAVLGMIFPQEGWVWQLVSFAVSMVVFVGLFALMFKYLPDVSIGWRDVMAGAVLTAVLFAIGKFGIGLYLSYSTDSAHGGAGSLIALLTWVYYSALIVFFGAEVTQAYARARGSTIEPDEHAEWAEDAPEANDGRRADAPRRRDEAGRPGHASLTRSENEKWSDTHGQEEQERQGRGR